MRGIAVAKFSIAFAKTRFSELIQKAMAGEEVIITKDNKAVVKVVPIVSPGKKRISGPAKRQIWMAPDFDATHEDLIWQPVSDVNRPRSAITSHWTLHRQAASRNRDRPGAGLATA
jgi:prevent-host-death family protein